jgi:hypothetical protein
MKTNETIEALKREAWKREPLKRTGACPLSRLNAPRFNA